MSLALTVEPQLVRAVVLALLGVGFWVGGVVVANYLWKHYRGEE